MATQLKDIQFTSPVLSGTTVGDVTTYAFDTSCRLGSVVQYSDMESNWIFNGSAMGVKYLNGYDVAGISASPLRDISSDDYVLYLTGGSI